MIHVMLQCNGVAKQRATHLGSSPTIHKAIGVLGVLLSLWSEFGWLERSSALRPHEQRMVLANQNVNNVSKWHDEYHRSPRNLLRHWAPVNPQEATADFWAGEARAAIAARRPLARGGGAARNVVLFLGDGMSVPTLAAARALLGQRAGRPGEEAQLAFEAFPSVGLAKTYCVDSQIPDSACTATAYLCGVKTNLGTIGVTAAVPRRDCAASAERAAHVQSIAAWALQDGRDAGIVTTTRVTHASPSGAYAHVADRDWESDADVRADGHDPEQCPDIAYQLVHSYPGNQFKVILGGGRREFLPEDTVDEEGTRGRRRDGRRLIDEWRADKVARNASHQYVWHRDQLLAASASPPEYLLGLFEGSHLQYHLEADAQSEPTLAELTEAAIRALGRNEKGFFLFVEGGRIDHAHHDNQPALALDETIELSAAVARAAALLDEADSLLVVTADHAHVMAFNGYTHRGGDILGPSDDVGDDGAPYMTLSYTNGPGHRVHAGDRRPDVTQDADYRSARWRSHADVPLASETHGGEDVGVFARGPQASMFTGVFEQSQLPHLMAYAACLGPGPRACESAA
ncbi:membrane-bound alkaline phosphatase-like [Pararge aegeria]|uniref:membrane-bound alkaline phosphatase-like n=1 Tax=Pararge aegeria TaxID=116150 RepID=UPI0019D08501|nr:membrane-bound alkaline phosphatase-like [Pararge aegeria]